jgi:hypothetical protein
MISRRFAPGFGMSHLWCFSESNEHFRFPGVPFCDFCALCGEKSSGYRFYKIALKPSFTIRGANQKGQ